MRAFSTSPVVEEMDNLTIPEAEELIEEALGDLAEQVEPGTDTALQRALRFLAPPGYQAIVELCGENGRSKRRNADAATWTPEEDEVRIYFEKIEDDTLEELDRVAIVSRPRTLLRSTPNLMEDSQEETEPSRMPADIDEKIKELCATLAEAERGGHAFIALKWFRDSFLPRKSFPWNQNPESRQLILAEAILRGVVLTSKIPNPKTPAYPTTTIRLNRAEPGIPEEAQRFRPVAVQDGAVGLLDEDRGNL